MKKILLIDDDVVFQKTLGEKLRSLSYEIVLAGDGEVGLEKASSEKPDLIVLDINMPKLDGLGFLKQLRERTKEEVQVPVLITSNLSNFGTISEGVALGVRGYIVKSDESLDSIAHSIEDIFESVKGS